MKQSPNQLGRAFLTVKNDSAKSYEPFFNVKEARAKSLGSFFSVKQAPWTWDLASNTV